MARKNYESQVFASATQFINKQKEAEKKSEVPKEKKIEQPKAEGSKEVAKKVIEKKITEETKKIETTPVETRSPAIDPSIDIDALLDAKFKEYLMAKNKNDKRRVYEEETTMISVKLEKSIYNYAKQQGPNMTQYIKNLIKADMEKNK